MVDLEQFLEFEQDYSLFDIEINGVPVWERLRFSTWQMIAEQSGMGQVYPSLIQSKLDILRGAKLLLNNIFYRNPFFARSTDFLFIGHQRRKKLSDEKWWDIYCDPIYEECSLDYAHFEEPYLLTHNKPAKTKHQRYLDLIIYLGTIQRKLGLHNITLSSEEESALDAIQKELRSRFDVDIPFKAQVCRTLNNRKSRLWLFEHLLDKVEPQIAVVIVSYGQRKMTFIEACKRKKIPVVELQHGIINRNHVAYSYPDNQTSTIFPDYLFTWGDFWTEGDQFPIPEERVVPVGYPYIDRWMKTGEETPKKNQILFISQGTIGEDLSKFAIEVRQNIENTCEIIYKLHPGEYDRWKDEYPWLVDADIQVVDSNHPSLYKLFSDSKVQIGVNSTAIYEGLAFGLETYIYDCQGSSDLDPLIEQDTAKLISSAGELLENLGQKNSSFERGYYFTPNATERICNELHKLANEGSTFEL